MMCAKSVSLCVCVHCCVCACYLILMRHFGSVVMFTFFLSRLTFQIGLLLPQVSVGLKVRG